MQIVAKRGFSATLSIAKKSITVTQFEPIDLSVFTEDQLNTSNLSTLLENGWVEVYEGQKLPKGPSLPKIPVVKSAVKQGEKDTQVKLTVSQDSKKHINTNVAISENLPDELHKKVVAEKAKQEADAQRHVANVKAEPKDRMPKMKPLTQKELARPVMVDGVPVEGGEDGFKLPKIQKSEDNSKSN